jgi:chromosome partitioning protein
VGIVVTFISQKGGVGKSTLARALATFARESGLTTKVVDLDQQQKTLTIWEHTRSRHGIKPAIHVEDASPSEALKLARTSDLLIIDTAGKITEQIHELAKQAHLVVQPTSPSSDDMHISVLVFLAMERVGIPRERLAFALSAVLSKSEEKDARAFLTSFGYPVLEGSIPSNLAYRDAMKVGRSILETKQRTLNGTAHRLISEMLQAAMRNAGKKKRSGGRA